MSRIKEPRREIHGFLAINSQPITINFRNHPSFLSREVGHRLSNPLPFFCGINRTAAAPKSLFLCFNIRTASCILVARRTRVIRKIYITLALTFLLGCSPSHPPASATTPIHSDQEVYLAVWHHMFAHWKGHPFDFPNKFFLQIDDQDVSADLLTRFRGEGYDVAPGSKYQHGRGIHCFVRKIEWISSSEAKVWGGYVFGSEGGEIGYFNLKFDHNKWTVISWKPEVFA